MYVFRISAKHSFSCLRINNGMGIMDLLMNEVLLQHKHRRVRAAHHISAKIFVSV